MIPHLRLEVSNELTLTWQLLPHYDCLLIGCANLCLAPRSLEKTYFELGFDEQGAMHFSSFGYALSMQEAGSFCELKRTPYFICGCLLSLTILR